MKLSEAFDALTDKAVDMCESSNWDTTVTQVQLVLAGALGHPALVLQALGVEREWICGVSDSGFHNGVNCRPSEPHNGWDCEWVLELRVRLGVEQ